MKEAQKLQIIQQNMHNLMHQRQQFHAKLDEIENALMELRSTDSGYKIIGNIMVSAKSSDLIKELEENRDLVKKRMESIEKQEAKLKEEMTKTQESLMKNVQDDK